MMIDLRAVCLVRAIADDGIDEIEVEDDKSVAIGDGCGWWMDGWVV